MPYTHGPSRSHKFTWSLTILLQVATERSAGSHTSHDPPSRDHTMQCSLAMSRRHDPRPTRWHSHTTRCRTARSRMALSRSTAEPHSSIGESRRTAGEGPWSSGAALSVLSLLLHVPYVMICSVSDVKRHVRKSIISVCDLRKCFATYGNKTFPYVTLHVNITENGSGSTQFVCDRDLNATCPVGVVTPAGHAAFSRHSGAY